MATLTLATRVEAGSKCQSILEKFETFDLYQFYRAAEGFFMARVCQLTGKKANNAYAISHSHRRTKKLQEPNLQWKRIWWAEGKRWVRLRLSTKAIKTLDRNGLTAMAKAAGINLNLY